MLNLSNGGGKLASAATADSFGFGVVAASSTFIWAAAGAAVSVDAGTLVATGAADDESVVIGAVGWTRGVIVSAISAAVACCWVCWAL